MNAYDLLNYYICYRVRDAPRRIYARPREIFP